MTVSQTAVLREEVAKQRALLVRALPLIGMSAGTIASLIADQKTFSYPLRDQATEAMRLASDISNHLAEG